jgi:two-component system sensor histidine kinase KdpD
MVVFFSAICSALLWNFLFIPPKLTFSIASLEDVLMFLAFFLAAFVGGFLTSRLKEKELALSLRERRMAFLYGFTRSISSVRGIREVADFTRDYLGDHLGLHSVVCLRNDAGELDTSPVSGSESESVSASGFQAGNAILCLETKACVDDGDDRLYFPLGSQESMLGVLYVTGKGERTIRGESREILATLAGNMALALERELLAAENERNKMAGESARLSRILLNHVSHELRTPLTTIKGSVSGLLDGTTAEDPGLREALLSETLIAANKLNVLVEDLLAMSRLESGRMSPHLELAYVSELIGAAQPALGAELAGRTILLEESARDSEIDMDPALMTQVFRNLLRNFATYTFPGSVLRVGVAYVPGFMEVWFSDDGPGVPDAELPLIFDTFYRGSGSAARQGCGLGLSICRGITEVHGGSIEAHRSVEGGLLITIRLPRKGGL